MTSLSNCLEITRFVVQKLLIPAIVAFGCLCNFITIVVLTRRRMKSSTNFYLSALAVYDTLYLVFALTMTFMHYDTIKDHHIYVIYRVYIGRPFMDIWSNTSVCLTVTFTVERYISVCYPMKGKIWCTISRARYVVLCVCLSTAAITLPEFFDSKVQWLKAANESQLMIVSTRMGESPSYNLGYINFNQALFTFLPLILLLIFNTLLIRSVMTANAARRRMMKEVAQAGVTIYRQASDQNRITVMLIAVVIVFLLCQLPQAVVKLYGVYLQLSDSYDGVHRLAILIAGNICNLLVTVNCSVNFVLYSAFSTNFRRTFQFVFLRRLWKKKYAISESQMLMSNAAETDHHHQKRTATTFI